MGLIHRSTGAHGPTSVDSPRSRAIASRQRKGRDHRPAFARFSACRLYQVRRDMPSLSQGFLASLVLPTSSIRGRPCGGVSSPVSVVMSMDHVASRPSLPRLIRMRRRSGDYDANEHDRDEPEDAANRPDVNWIVSRLNAILGDNHLGLANRWRLRLRADGAHPLVDDGANPIVDAACSARLASLGSRRRPSALGAQPRKKIPNGTNPM